MAAISASLVKELRDAHRRGDDGLQARARGDERRPRRGGQAPAREGHRAGGEARRPRDDRGQGRASTSTTAVAARWSPSAARPSRSPTTRSSSIFVAARPRRGREARRAGGRRARGRARRAVREARREHRRPRRGPLRGGGGRGPRRRTSHPPANKIGVLVHGTRQPGHRAATLAMHIAVRRAALQ